MIKIYVDYDISCGHWEYYYYDSNNYRTTTSGFENHIIAKEHATDIIGIDIEFLYK